MHLLGTKRKLKGLSFLIFAEDYVQKNWRDIYSYNKTPQLISKEKIWHEQLLHPISRSICEAILQTLTLWTQSWYLYSVCAYKQDSIWDHCGPLSRKDEWFAQVLQSYWFRGINSRGSDNLHCSRSLCTSQACGNHSLGIPWYERAQRLCSQSGLHTEYEDWVMVCQVLK